MEWNFMIIISMGAKILSNQIRDTLGLKEMQLSCRRNRRAIKNRFWRKFEGEINLMRTSINIKLEDKSVINLRN
jgi:hypothetical protein